MTSPALALHTDPGTCPHPLRRARFDKPWRLDDRWMAQVTCGVCHGSFVIPMREDAEALLSLVGGPRAVVMPDDTTPEPAESSNPAANPWRS